MTKVRRHQRIEMEPPWATTFKHGYIHSQPQNHRKIVSLMGKNPKDNRRMHYARYLLGVKLGYIPPREIHADHINDDPTDDRIENIQPLSWLNNIKKFHNYIKALPDKAKSEMGIKFISNTKTQKIKKLALEGLSYREIARRVKVDPKTVATHIKQIPNFENLLPKKPDYSVKINEMYNQGYFINEIAKIIGKSTGYVKDRLQINTPLKLPYIKLPFEKTTKVLTMLEQGICINDIFKETEVPLGSIKKIAKYHNLSFKRYKPKLTPEIIEEFNTLLRQGKNLFFIENLYSIHRNVIKKYVDKSIQITYTEQKNVTPEDIAEFNKLFNEGKKISEITKLTNFSHSTIKRNLNPEARTTLSKKFLTNEEINLAEELASEGYSLREIAEKLNRGYTTIKSVLSIKPLGNKRVPIDKLILAAKLVKKGFSYNKATKSYGFDSRTLIKRFNELPEDLNSINPYYRILHDKLTIETGYTNVKDDVCYSQFSNYISYNKYQVLALTAWYDKEGSFDLYVTIEHETEDDSFMYISGQL